ncbi:hypothetical protein [Aureimonas phyllosphaerae]|uniref:Uncharacterized protein n=1 Tax=Aureimonas phyllosphaerae TaxID=1166078 RepID=A0A7W6FUX6_9HYPH|nr:hypothetical protein [Aureimonas phyllosphaerae]MBB3936556.1 hypothetical protein [Aureimonas phyllosphaerae]MBB3960580.1 hypothetical protein [Aureimonas phyllosphaerae]
MIVDEFASPKARSRMLAGFAREQIEKTQIENETALGRTIRKPRVSVDGKLGAALSTVKPDGTIVAEFNVEAVAVRWILRELELISPTLTGAYRASHTVFADGQELALSADGEIPNAFEYVIVSTLPYAKKLDPKDGLPARSKQAPRGVYAAISAVAAMRFENEATIRFTFREVNVSSGKTLRQPAISVRPV